MSFIKIDCQDKEDFSVWFFIPVFDIARSGKIT
jgi:hypothetical protein